jgi:hypothetical protein
MPRGPKGERRPADVNARAVMIAKIATGEIEDVTTEDGKNAAAVALGRMGGKARAKGMSAKRRREIARDAATDPGNRLPWPAGLAVGHVAAGGLRPLMTKGKGWYANAGDTRGRVGVHPEYRGVKVL